MRTAKSCTFRRPFDGTAAAACGILVELTGLTTEACRVPEEACAFCCRPGPAPTPKAINSLVASYLFDLSRSLLELADQRRADYRKWQSLFQLAERHLEVPAECSRDRNRNPVDRLCGHVGPSTGRTLEDFEGEPRLISHYLCGHPAHFETTLEECMICGDWEQFVEKRTVPLDVLLPPLRPRCGRSIHRWAVGVTTAPREDPKLAETLDSIERSGWSTAHLFVDGEAAIPAKYGQMPRTHRGRQMGAWPNFYLALWELVRLHPEADAFLMLQDDTTLYSGQNLRKYLEGVLWFGHRAAVASLYCPSVYTQPRFGWRKFAGRWVWGAPALVFSREAARRFLADAEIQGHRGGERQAQIDVAVGRWAEREDVPIFYPTPSLAQHVGETSSIWSRGRAIGSRRANLALAEEPR